MSNRHSIPARRKPLDPGCVGGIFCPVEGHVVTRCYKNGRVRVSHIPLTPGQSESLRERRRAATQERQAQERRATFALVR